MNELFLKFTNKEEKIFANVVLTNTSKINNKRDFYSLMSRNGLTIYQTFDCINKLKDIWKTL